MTTIALKERPFVGPVRILPLAEPASIQQILDSQKDLPLEFMQLCEVRINGELVPAEMWRYVKLKPAPGRHVSVTMTMGLHSSGGAGKKNVWAMVASIAVLLVAAAVSGGALGIGAFVAEGIGTTVAVGNAIAGAAIGIAGSLAIAALTPPPSLGNGPATDTSGTGTSGQASLSGNVLTKGGPVPRVIGTHRVFPILLSAPLIETVGEDSYAEAIYGLSGPHFITDPLVGTTSISTLEEVSYEIQEGLPNSPQNGLVVRQSYTDSTIALKMSQHIIDRADGTNKLDDQTNPANSSPHWEGMSTRVAPDEFWIPLTFPSGLINTAGNNMCVDFKVRIRQRGQTDWINLPIFQVVHHTQKQFEITVKLMWRSPIALQLMPGIGGPVRSWLSWDVQQDNAGTGASIGGWVGDPYFYDTTVQTDITTTGFTYAATGTGGGNAFNGTNSKVAASCWTTTTTGSINANVAKQWAGHDTHQTISRVKIFAPTDRGFTTSANPNFVLTVEGGHDSDFTPSTILYQATIASTGANQVIDLDINTSGIDCIPFHYHRFSFTEVAGDAGSHSVIVAEIQVFAGNDPYLYSSNFATTGMKNLNLYDDRIEFYLNDPVRFPKSGVWEVQVMRGQGLVNGDLTILDHSLAGIDWYDTFGWRFNGSNFVANYDQSQIADAVTINRVSSIWNEHPTPDPSKFAIIAIRVKNRSVDQFSVLASGYTRDWDGVGWNTVTTTSNPAPHLRDVLGGTLGGSPLPPEIIDDDSILAWRTHCIANDYTCDAVVEGKTYLDVLTMIASSGYARLAHSEKWGVFMDRDRSADAPVQIFSPRNLKDFSWTKAFTTLPTGIRAAYNDSADSYRPAETFVFADPANVDASRLEQITYDGLVEVDKVEARAAFDLLQSQVRMTFYSGTADIESIVCQRGDLVGVQHDILMTQAGFARVASVARSGGNITGLTLDGTIPVATRDGVFDTDDLYAEESFYSLGSSTGVMIRLAGGAGFVTSEVRADEDGDVNTVTFLAPFADPGGLEEDCHVVSGEFGSEYLRLIVFAVSPSKDLTAKITFVDEAQELWN